MIQAELAGNNCDTKEALSEVLEQKDLSIDIQSLILPEVIEVNGAYENAALISTLSEEKPKRIMVTESNFIVTKARGHKEMNCVALHKVLDFNESACKGKTGKELQQYFLEMKRRKGEKASHIG